MDSEQNQQIIDKILLFEGFSDLTFYEIKAWRSVMYNIIGANRLYVEKLKDAVDVLNVFDKLDDTYSTNSKSAAERVSGLLSQMSNYHDDVYGDFARFTSPDGPFGGLLGANDQTFVELIKRTEKQKKEHEEYEKASKKAWKKYEKKEKRRQKLEGKLSKKGMCGEDMLQHKQYATFKQKAECALRGYENCHQQEEHHREKLLRQTVEIRKEFYKDEKDKLSKMFAFINNSIDRLQKLVPQGLAETEDLNFSPEVVNTKRMAKASWEGYLQEHKFPRKKEENQISNQVEDEGDEDDSNESDSESDMSDNQDQGEKTYTPVQTFKAPKLSRQDSGISDALQEINEDIDNQPSFLRLRDSPEPQRPLFTPNPDWEPAKDRPISPESVDGMRPKSGSIRQKNVNAGSGTGSAGTGVASESRRRRRASKLAKELGITEQSKTTKGSLPTTDEDQVVCRTKIPVVVMRDYEKKSSKELTIRKGMRIKQTRCADDNGMAYGYKKTKMGLKKYGLFPAVCGSPEEPEHLR